MAMFRKGSSSKNLPNYEETEHYEETERSEEEEEEEEEFDEDQFDEELEEEEDPKSEEERALEIFNDDELQNLWCYVNQVSLQGRLYFRNEIKIDDTTISNKVASFNLLIKKKTKNGVKRHRIYVKTYNKEIIEWLTEQKVGTWVKVEGRLEAASSKTYVNATSITAFSDERIKAIFEGFNEVDSATQNVDWKDFDKNRADPEINKEALRKLKEIKQQTRKIAMNSNCVYIEEDDKPVTAAASKESLSEKDLMDLAALTQELVASYPSYISSLSELYDDDRQEEERAPRNMSLKDTMRRNPIRDSRPSVEDPINMRRRMMRGLPYPPEDEELNAVAEDGLTEYMYQEPDYDEPSEYDPSELDENPDFFTEDEDDIGSEYVDDIPELTSRPRNNVPPERTNERAYEKLPEKQTETRPTVPQQPVSPPAPQSVPQAPIPTAPSEDGSQPPLPVGARLVKSELISSIKSRFRSGGRFDRRNRR